MRRFAMIVIGVGIVVAIDALFLHRVVPRIWPVPIEHGIRKVDADIPGIKEALELFEHDCGLYPADLETLVVDKSKSATCSGTYDPDGYLDKVPVDPWGRPYVFLGDGHRYIIASYGADGKRGGRGNDADVESRNF